jgi:predicted ATPase
MIHYLARHLASIRFSSWAPCGPRRWAAIPFHSFQRQLGREGLVQSRNLAGLSPQAIEALLAEMSGSGQAVAPLARRLYAETEGNPFFLIESLKALFDAAWSAWRLASGAAISPAFTEAELPLPVGVSEAIQARVRRLDEEAQASPGGGRRARPRVRL